MPNSNYPKGFADGVTVRGIPVLNLYPGVVFWVDSVHGSNGNSKGTFDRPFGTIDYAIGRCTADHGDLIVVKAGHTEVVAAAAGLAFDVAGVGVYFLGAGSNKATITFTAAAATMVVSAANVTLIQPRFLTGIDAVAAAINVQAADFQMYNAEYYDAAAKATTIQVLTTSAADRMVIDGYKFFASTTGTAKTDGIKTVAGDSIVLRNIDINGDFSTSPIDVSTAATKLTLENINVNNVNVGPLAAITLHANTTGFAKNVKARVASGTTYISSVAKVQWADDCEGFSTDGYGGEPLGTVLSTGLGGKIDVIDGYFDAPTADATTDTTIRDAIGRKTDAAVTVVAATKSLMAYLKGAINWLTVGVADATSNASAADVIGNKTDASVYVPGTTKALAAYAKGSADLQERVAISATAALADATTIFTIAGGTIKVEALVSECVATGDGGAATLQYSADPTVGAAGTISGATGSLATAVAGSTVILAGTALATTPLFSVTGPNLLANPGTIIIPPGIITTVVGGAASTATWKHYLRYKPLQVGVTVS